MTEALQRSKDQISPYGFGTLAWQDLDRDQSCREILEFAVDVLASNGPVTVALTLARTAGHYFAERAMAEAGKSMRGIVTDSHKAFLVDLGWKDARSFTQLMFQDADRLRHFEVGQPPTIRTCRAQVAMLLLFAITDLRRTTATAGQKLEEWAARELPRMQGFRFSSPPPPQYAEFVAALATEAQDWNSEFRRPRRSPLAPRPSRGLARRHDARGRPRAAR